jgi:hypothetical protein
MTGRAAIVAGILGCTTLIATACAEQGSERQQTGGTGESPNIQTEQGSEGSGEGSDDTTGNGSEGNDTDPTPKPSEPKVQDVDFTCAKGEIKWQIDNTPVEPFAAREFPTTDKDDKINGGIFPYENPGDVTENYAISFFSDGEKLPGDMFTGWGTFYRGAEKKLYSCSDNSAENYFKYIEGSTTAPFLRHFEGVMFNLYDTDDCSGQAAVKKFSFCIHVQNQN